MDRFAGGPDSFLYKGSNGRWRDALTPDDLAPLRRDGRRARPGLRAWLEGKGLS